MTPQWPAPPVSHLVSDVIRRPGPGAETTHGVLTQEYVNHKAEGCRPHYRGSVDPPSSAIFLWLHYQASLGAGAVCPQSPGPIPGIIKQHIDQQQQHY